jgi:hypothetical protein
MACLIVEVCLLILGIITLVKGQINVSKDKMIVGAPARWIGAILLLPLPVAFLVGFFWAMMIVAQGRNPDPKEMQPAAAIIEIGIFGVCMLAVFLIATASEKVPVVKPEKRRARVEEDEYEEDYYEDRRRPAPMQDNAIREEHIHPESAPEPVREPSPIRVQCTSCKGTVGIPDSAVGKSVQCPLCSAVFVAESTPPPVHVQCSHCKKELSVPASALGKSVKCPLCTEIFTAQLQDTGFRS